MSIDANSDNRVTHEEAWKAFNEHCASGSESSSGTGGCPSLEEVTDIFDILDTNGDRVIYPEEAK